MNITCTTENNEPTEANYIPSWRVAVLTDGMVLFNKPSHMPKSQITWQGVIYTLVIFKGRTTLNYQIAVMCSGYNGFGHSAMVTVVTGFSGIQTPPIWQNSCTTVLLWLTGWHVSPPTSTWHANHPDCVTIAGTDHIQMTELSGLHLFFPSHEKQQYPVHHNHHAVLWPVYSGMFHLNPVREAEKPNRLTTGGYRPGHFQKVGQLVECRSWATES